MNINKNLIINKENGDYIIFNSDTDKFYALNEVTAFIWGLIVEGIEEAKIIQEVVKCYDVNEEKVKVDMKDILQELRNEKILL